MRIKFICRKRLLWRLLHTSLIVLKNVPSLVICGPPCCDILATALLTTHFKRSFTAGVNNEDRYAKCLRDVVIRQGKIRIAVDLLQNSLLFEIHLIRILRSECCFRFRFGVLGGERHKWRWFWVFLATFACTWNPSYWAIILSQDLSETRPKSASLEPLNDSLANL